MDGKTLFDGSSRRAVAAVLREALSGHESSARFGAAQSTVINWVRRFRETGGVAPGQMGGARNEFHLGPESIRIRRMLERPIGSVRWKEDTPDRSTGDTAPIASPATGP